MIARVFPRRTNATPTDALAFIGEPPLFPVECDEVHVSCTFTYDRHKAEELARVWADIAPVKMGGPAFDDPGGEFVPGMYLRDGYVITSRGCPNNCWFCYVPNREGDIREIKIHDGWNVLDSNLLACSDAHIDAVFAMLKRQSRKAEFTGGLEAKRLTWQIAQKLAELKPKQVFFAYDTPDDLRPLREAGVLMQAAGFTRASHALRCYVLCGWAKDDFASAENRMRQAWEAGFLPMAMLYRDNSGRVDGAWRAFQRTWARPAIIKNQCAHCRPCRCEDEEER